MARQPRFVLPGQPQHLIQRGNNRQSIFVTPKDYEFYLEKLSDAAIEHSCHIHAYVLMTNHVHLLVSPMTSNGLSKLMQTLGRYYVQYFNYHNQRTGTLWEGRYKACLIHSEQYLFTCMRYIELNPVRAGMVEHPEDYCWSSYHYNALGAENLLIQPHSQYIELGQTPHQQQKCYQAMFDPPLQSSAIEEMREVTNKCWVLGDAQFKKSLEKQLARRIEPSAKGGDRRSKRYLESN
jgi:putative transposase